MVSKLDCQILWDGELESSTWAPGLSVRVATSVAGAIAFQLLALDVLLMNRSFAKMVTVIYMIFGN